MPPQRQKQKPRSLRSRRPGPPALAGARLPGGPAWNDSPPGSRRLLSGPGILTWGLGFWGLAPCRGGGLVLRGVGDSPACGRAPGSTPPGRAAPRPAPRSPLRGLRPSGDDPCRLRSLRSLRAPLAHRNGKGNKIEGVAGQQARDCPLSLMTSKGTRHRRSPSPALAGGRCAAHQRFFRLKGPGRLPGALLFCGTFDGARKDTAPLRQQRSRALPARRRLNAGIAGPRGPALSKMASVIGHFPMRNEENPQKSKRQALPGLPAPSSCPGPFFTAKK